VQAFLQKNSNVKKMPVSRDTRLCSKPSISTLFLPAGCALWLLILLLCWLILLLCYDALSSGFRGLSSLPCYLVLGQATAPIIRLLPAILRLFPQFARVTLEKGKLIPLQTIDPMSEAELARQLNVKLRIPKQKDFNDKTHVVKISDVISCFEKTNDEQKYPVKIALDVASALLSATPAEPLLKEFSDDFIKCVRDKSLKQTAKRKRITYRYAKREI
jgi:hypothetical protein